MPDPPDSFNMRLGEIGAQTGQDELRDQNGKFAIFVDKINSWPLVDNAGSSSAEHKRRLCRCGQML
jgi:hypothetical protein